MFGFFPVGSNKYAFPLAVGAKVKIWAAVISDILGSQRV
jgi:hypothetical protein